jgi:hypothetical protein
MGVGDFVELTLRGGLIQQVLVIVAGALALAGMSLYVVLVVVRKERK